MLLNVLERIMLLQVATSVKEGSFITLKILREIPSKVGFSEQELKDYEIVEKPENGEIKWNQKGKEEVEIELGDKAIEIVATVLKDLDTQKKLTANHMSLFEKFVQDK